MSTSFAGPGTLPEVNGDIGQDGARPKTYSMTRKLIATVLLVELVAAVCVSGAGLVYERHAHFRSFDIMLRGRADSVLGAVQDAGDPQDDIMLDKTELNTPADDIYEVRDEAGRVIGRSPNWSGAPDRAFQPLREGFLWLGVNGKPYRCLRLRGLRVVDPGDKGGGTPRRVTILYGSPTVRVWKAVIAAAAFYGAVNALLLLVTGLVMAWLLHRSLDPLRLLAVEACGVSVDSWRFHPPESALKMKELAPLSIALQTVLQRLERSFVQQRRFVGEAAHELKTGVAVVKSSLQLLAMKPRTSEEYKAGLERCEADCDRMEDIVHKMLTLASVEGRERVPVAAGHTDLSTCIHEVADQFASMATLRRIQIIVEAPQPVFAGIAAQECLLLLSNLVLNAIQHSYPESHVIVSASYQGDRAALRVEDHGEGIHAVALPHVFERFFRGDVSRDRNTGGTGLGLAICKAIVDQASGHIHIESDGEAGTAVNVSLPVAIPG